MTNTNCLENIKCPDCGNAQSFRIAGKTIFTVTDDGTEDYGDVEWDDDSYAECPACKRQGTLKDFTVGTDLEPEQADIAAATAASQHTPGPWGLRQSKQICDNDLLVVASNDGGKTFGGHIVTHLCDPAKYKTCKNFSPDEQIANARLIAAAPELLEALARLAYDAGGDQDNPLIRHKTLESIERANATIANAIAAS